VNTYSYRVIVSAPNKLAAAAFVGSLRELADMANDGGARFDVVEITLLATDLGEMPAIDTIPLF
jgi:hypothetical protein